MPTLLGRWASVGIRASGQGFGGGLYIAAKAKQVSIDMATVITNNTANTDQNIDGSYTLPNC